MAVPELLIGNILGKNGSAIREIAFLSGAKISVSSRGEYVAGTTNRLVSITGVSNSAQTAHNLISQKLQQPLRMNQKRFSNPDVAVLEETDSSTDLNDNGELNDNDGDDEEVDEGEKEGDSLMRDLGL
eukprot:CAMPEP_0119036896 /NCGR_PEP_ID=MMETSP1177-20130426/4918_1 /TAXON_ID=2985 /ORGANISM="Ochromonas sp, Strain CCMP1899" /LENGTH=127 /DNA_ID=CAMNT_0006997399 /DNA_START=102 /DNA_END=485 /DNA_ORIENTATION=-